MAGSWLQQAGTAFLRIQPVQSHGNSRQQSLAMQQVLSQDCNCNLVRDRSLPVMPGSLRLCEPGIGIDRGAQCSPEAREEPRPQLFVDPTSWWDDRQHKNSYHFPEFQNGEAKKGFRPWKPARVDKQLAAVDMNVGPPAHTPSLNLLNPGPRSVIGYEIDVTAEDVSKLCEKGQLGEAVDALSVLVEAESSASKSLFYDVLNSCVAQKNLALGRRVHQLSVKAGHESNTFLANHILRMYASHGRLQEARDVFTRVRKPDAFSWSAVIAAHAKHGEPKQAVKLYQQMRSSSVKADAHVFVAALQACASAADLESGKQVQADLLRSGVQPNLIVWNCLVHMYVKCGRLDGARMIFDSLSSRNVVTWNVMLAGYAERGLGQEALALYARMDQEGVIVADPITFACLLKACARVGALQQGKQLHSQILEKGLGSDITVGTCLVDMYAKCGRLEDARTVFDELVTEDLVPCDRMASLLKACATVGALQQGRQMHSQVVERGLEGDMCVCNSLVDMYAKCGRLEEARRLFDSLGTRDVVTWNVMIAGYVEHGNCHEALALHVKMEQEGVVVADTVTFACLLKACASAGALQQGKQIHSQILKRGLEADTRVGTSLLDMYAKCGKLEEAHKIFDSLPTRDLVTWNTMIGGYVKCGRLNDAHRLFDMMVTKDVVTWTAMIAGYAEHGLGQEALALYDRMKQESLIVVNAFTFACLLKACATVGALQQGKLLHSQILKQGVEADMFVASSLVDMYAKCGKLEEACRFFDSLPSKDVVTWNAMINGFGHCNEGRRAVECFHDMVGDGVQADESTYTCLLVACSHEGLVQEGEQFFKAMVEERGIKPSIQHYTCMVDLFGRAGYLDEAEKMLLSYESNDVGFTSLLNACRSHGDMERGRRCFERLVRLDSQNAAAYVLMGNIYADAGRWSDVERIKRLRKLAGASKKPAVAGIEVDRHVHTFVVGEDKGDISSKTRSMVSRLQVEGGHLPHTALVLKGLSEKGKEDDLCGHAEKLALAYGLLHTTDGTPLLVTKNLRMCGDCHSSTEIMSRIEKREIIVRDAHRVHRFYDGSCCCGGRP